MSYFAVSFKGTNGDAIPPPMKFSADGAGTGVIASDKAELTAPASASFPAAHMWLPWATNDVEILGRATPGQLNSLGACTVELGGGAFNANQNVSIDGVGAFMEAGGGTITFFKMVAGTYTALVTVSGGSTVAASNPIMFKFRKIGMTLSAKCWDPTATVESAERWAHHQLVAGGPNVKALYPTFHVSSQGAGAAGRFAFDMLQIDLLQPKIGRRLLYVR